MTPATRSHLDGKLIRRSTDRRRCRSERSPAPPQRSCSPTIGLCGPPRPDRASYTGHFQPRGHKPRVPVIPFYANVPIRANWICEQLAADPRIQSQRLREMAGELGYQGGLLRSRCQHRETAGGSGRVDCLRRRRLVCRLELNRSHTTSTTMSPPTTVTRMRRVQRAQPSRAVSARAEGPVTERRPQIDGRSESAPMTPICARNSTTAIVTVQPFPHRRRPTSRPTKSTARAPRIANSGHDHQCAMPLQYEARAVP
jgi:hypothetical protein